MKTTLLESGYKLTKSRQAIIDLLEKSNEHMDADTIYNALDHSIGIATIYRSLDLLSSLGLVECLCFDGTKYYRGKIKHKHVHFICEECQKIFEYTDETLESTLLNQEHYIKEKYGHFIQSGSTIFRGICKTCKAHK